MLADRRRELTAEVQGRIRDARTAGTNESEVIDQGETSEVDIQDEIEFALIHMKAAALKQDRMPWRSAGSRKAPTGGVLSAAMRSPRARLLALPFAVRCKDCEEARETAELRERIMTQRRGSSTLFVDIGS